MDKRDTYISPSNNNNMYNNQMINENFEEEKNNIDFYNNNINNQELYLVNNEYDNQYINNDIQTENKEEIKNDNIIKNNLINTNSNKTTKINSDEINRNLIITDDNINNDNNVKNSFYDDECKLIFSGESNNLQELRIPIISQFSSIISNYENILNYDLIIDIIIKNISSIDDIENKIILPKKEDIYLKINGKIYSKLTQTEIKVNEVEKYTENNKN